VEQVVIGLAAALSRLTDGEEEYLFLAHPREDQWIRPFLSGPCRLLHTRMEYPGQRRPFRGLGQALRRGAPFLQPRPVELLHSDLSAEQAGAEVIHFPMQEAFLTSVPSIYHPHDLQHLHLPELFDEETRARREVLYRGYCERAEMVVMMTEWGRRDLITHYGLPPEVVRVISWGSVISAYRAPTQVAVDTVRRDMSLAERFLLYPAQTWPHKNHVRLLEALALLRDRDGITVSLVCPGRRNSNFPEIERRIRALRLDDQVCFPGFVGPDELRALFVLADGLVFPSLFEGFGMPVCEAFECGLPVASSTATGLPEVVGDAGLLFDPENVDAIAGSIRALWQERDLRERLIRRGHERAKLFSIDRAARIYRAHYRRIGSRQLTEEDRILLASHSPLPAREADRT
jgi:glycosyltransferase involved in cell wall biosynthesis